MYKKSRQILFRNRLTPKSPSLALGDVFQAVLKGCEGWTRWPWRARGAFVMTPRRRRRVCRPLDPRRPPPSERCCDCTNSLVRVFRTLFSHTERNGVFLNVLFWRRCPIPSTSTKCINPCQRWEINYGVVGRPRSSPAVRSAFTQDGFPMCDVSTKGSSFTSRVIK